MCIVYAKHMMLSSMKSTIICCFVSSLVVSAFVAKESSYAGKDGYSNKSTAEFKENVVTLVIYNLP